MKETRKENPKQIIISAYSNCSCNVFSVSTYHCFCHSLAHCTVMELMNKKSVLDDTFLLKSITSRPLSKISCSRSIILNKYRIYLVYIDLKTYILAYAIYCFLPTGAFRDSESTWTWVKPGQPKGTFRGANGEQVVKNFCKIAVF